MSNLSIECKIFNLNQPEHMFCPLPFKTEAQEVLFEFVKGSVKRGDIVIALFQKGSLIAATGLESFREDERFLYTRYVTVLEGLRHKGLGSVMIHEKYELAVRLKKGIIHSPYSEMGKEYVRHRNEDLALHYQVPFFSKEEYKQFFNLLEEEMMNYFEMENA